MALLTFEGIDGSGKSTQARLLIERLEAEGREVLLVREPGGAEVSERVRTLLLDPALTIAPRAELLLFSAARAQLVDERIRPALENGKVVICDRFYDSTTAYQGAGRGVAELPWLQRFHVYVTGGLLPLRTYYVDVPVKVAAARRRQARAQADRMEAGDERFYARVADGYAWLLEREPGRVLRLDGTQPVDVVHEAVWKDAATLLARQGAS